jgi:hypothetical protein
MRRTVFTILVAVAVGALAAPALAGAATNPVGKRGIVVQRDARAGAVVLATQNGTLLRVKLAKPNRLAMGSIVTVRGSKIRVVGHRHTAKLRGVVVRRHHNSFALADNGSVLAVTSPTPPAPGQQVTATVQVTPTELDDDNGDEQVNDAQVVGVEVRGTFLSADATTLLLAVPSFPAGLPIGIAGQTIPELTGLAVGTPVEARVALGPDPNNEKAIVLTLVRLHIEGENGQGEHEHGDFVKADGKVMSVTEAGAVGFAPGSITIAGEHGTVTFVIPAGFGATGVKVGDDVEAKGTAPTTSSGQPTLVRLESNNDDNNDNGASGGDNGDESGGGHSGGGDD